MGNGIAVDVDFFKRGDLVKTTLSPLEVDEVIMIDTGIFKTVKELEDFINATGSLEREDDDLLYVGTIMSVLTGELNSILIKKNCKFYVVGISAITKADYKAYKGCKDLEMPFFQPYMKKGVCKIGTHFKYDFRTKEMELGIVPTESVARLINEFLINYTDIKALLIKVEDKYELISTS